MYILFSSKQKFFLETFSLQHVLLTSFPCQTLKILNYVYSSATYLDRCSTLICLYEPFPSDMSPLLLSIAKCQLISKSLFVIFNSPKKRIKKFDFITMVHTSSRIVFVCFGGELKTPKRYFEINWPLASKIFKIMFILMPHIQKVQQS